LSVVGIQSVPESSNFWPPVSCQRRNPATGGPNGRIWPKWPGSNRIWTDPATDPFGSGQNGQDPARYDLIRQDQEDSGWNPAILAESGPSFSPKSGDGNQTLPDSGGICKTLIFSFRNFFVRTKI
jgi:hypothetical protein